MPRVATKRRVEAAELPVRQQKTRAMKSTGPAREALEPIQEVEAVERPVSKDFVEQLAFMEETLLVQVHQSTNPEDETIVEVFCNGRPQRFIRGMKQEVKRKFIEVLARARRTRFGNEKYKDAEGIDAYRYPSNTALRYPFTVLNDPNPRGPDWLRALLQEG